MFSFSCSFLVENATKTLRETLFLKLTRKPPQRIGPRLKRSLFISMTVVLSNGKFGYTCGVLAKGETDGSGGGLNLGGFRRETIKSHEVHASLLTATLAPARLLISNPLALSDINSTLTFGANHVPPAEPEA